MKYKETQKNGKLMAYTEKSDLCRQCGNKLGSTITILYQNGDPKICYSCNLKGGFID